MKIHKNKAKSGLCYTSLFGISLLTLNMHLHAMEKDDLKPNNETNQNSDFVNIPNGTASGFDDNDDISVHVTNTEAQQALSISNTNIPEAKNADQPGTIIFTLPDINNKIKEQDTYWEQKRKENQEKDAVNQAKWNARRSAGRIYKEKEEEVVFDNNEERKKGLPEDIDADNVTNHISKSDIKSLEKKMWQEQNNPFNISIVAYYDPAYENNGGIPTFDEITSLPAASIENPSSENESLQNARKKERQQYHQRVDQIQKQTNIRNRHKLGLPIDISNQNKSTIRKNNTFSSAPDSDPKKPANEEALRRAQIEQIEHAISMDTRRQLLSEGRYQLEENNAAIDKERFEIEKQINALNIETAHKKNSIWYGCKRQFGEQFFGGLGTGLGTGLGNGAVTLLGYVVIPQLLKAYNAIMLNPEENAEIKKMNIILRKNKVTEVTLAAKLNDLAMQEAQVKELNFSNAEAQERYAKLQNIRTMYTKYSSHINDEEQKRKMDELLKQSEIEEFLVNFNQIRKVQGLPDDPLKEFQVQLHNGSLLKKNTPTSNVPKLISPQKPGESKPNGVPKLIPAPATEA